MRAIFGKSIIAAAVLCAPISSAQADQTEPVGTTTGETTTPEITVGGHEALEDSAVVGQTWLLNTRMAPQCGWLGGGMSRVQFSKLTDNDAEHSDAEHSDAGHGPSGRGYSGRGHWVHGTFEQSIAENDPSMPMIVFVHGNRTQSGEAIRDGKNLRKRIASFSAEPFNFVIWSWPSNRIARSNRVDVRTKATRSDAQSYYLAAWLRELKHDKPETRISLIGYSFGSRIIAGALHMLGGGRIAGRTLPEVEVPDAPEEDDNAGVSNPSADNSSEGTDANGVEENAKWQPLRAVLIAGALDADWLLPGRRNGLALSQVDKMLVTKNDADPVLRWYPMIRSRRSEAMGYVGPRGCGRPYSDGGKVFTLDVNCPVGRAHSWCRYIASREINAHLAPYTFLHESEPPAKKTPVEAPPMPEIPQP